MSTLLSERYFYYRRINSGRGKIFLLQQLSLTKPAVKAMKTQRVFERDKGNPKNRPRK